MVQVVYVWLSRIQAPPPRSLQELLERQWEQTAQFILDQAGKQNNGEQEVDEYSCHDIS